MRACCALLVSIAIRVVDGSSLDECESLSLDYDVDGMAGIESACNACTARRGCGFCLSSGACLRGDDAGPAGVFCPTWHATTTSCPIQPTCDDHPTCGACVVDDSCAWCASEQRCMDLAQVYVFDENNDHFLLSKNTTDPRLRRFSRDCHSAVFDAPCPSSWVPETRVVGNFALDRDDAGDGAEIEITGSAPDGASFELLVNDEFVSLVSAAEVLMTAGDSEAVNTRAGGGLVQGGQGSILEGGDGGSVLLSAGFGNGQSALGPAGDGGNIELVAGQSIEGFGGGIVVLGGDGKTGPGGNVQLITGHSSKKSSGGIMLSTPPSGTIAIRTGATDRATGRVVFSTGASPRSQAGTIQLAAGTGGSNTGGRLRAIVFSTGAHESAQSGALYLMTANAGNDGSSGNVIIQSGAGTTGTSGTLTLATGEAEGSTGRISVDAGASYLSEGSNVLLNAGSGFSGGGVTVGGGACTAESAYAFAGGDVDVTGGSALGSGSTGGDVQLCGGESERGSSGRILLATANAGSLGGSVSDCGVALRTAVQAVRSKSPSALEQIKREARSGCCREDPRCANVAVMQRLLLAAVRQPQALCVSKLQAQSAEEPPDLC
ncbi:hypothetical protein CTAYLR_003387 [Chrysophaeum taylorii]|uniref:PSI domain-containing protein n=1 Tax=Chrysophaeum taylorii TaxID=2483200 RepID=A0AAD7UEU0_9STRA|nr:hypothetical protein CTAYLR_003387 [Chrysophaeum taylorii]